MGRHKGSKNVKGLFKQIIAPCEICGKEFTSYPSYREEPRKYCSMPCYRKSRKGWIPSKLTRERLSKSHIGKKPMLGKVTSVKTRKLLSIALSGSNCARWKGGINPVNDSIRKSLKYKIWREKVFERDGYKCTSCGSKNGNGKAVILNAHHIKEFSQFQELRFTVENGTTLCKECHVNIHKKEVTV